MSIDHVDRMSLEEILDANEFIDVSEDAENIARAAHAEASKDPEAASKLESASGPITMPEDPKEAEQVEDDIAKILELARNAHNADHGMGPENRALFDELFGEGNKPG